MPDPSRPQGHEPTEAGPPPSTPERARWRCSLTTVEDPTPTAEAEFAAALARFQAVIPHIGKDQTASVKSDKATYSYSYADLSDITHVALPLLAEQGLSWSAKTMMTPAGFLLLSSLRHSAGWSETCEWPLPNPVQSSAQQVGSALTYGRRYSFTALTGVAPGGEDDDAQAAAYRPAADVPLPDPIVAAKAKVWEQAQRLGLDIDGLRDRYAQDHDGQLLEDAQAGDLHAYAKQLSKLGANGLPLNKDGSVSIRQTTEEERVAAGMMSDEEKKAHKALTEEVTGDEKKATRTEGAADPGPWTDVTVATPGETVAS